MKINNNLAKLVLEDGTIMLGQALGAKGQTLGELVFQTGMTGYQETLTDPSYAGQIVVQTAPHIGNTGANEEDMESSRVWVNGYIVRDMARNHSNWRATKSLAELLQEAGTVGISEIDTRFLTRKIRDEGAMRAGIFSDESLALSEADLINIVKESPKMTGSSFMEQVTTESAYTLTPAQPKASVVAIDLGIKSATPKHLYQRGIEVHVLPASSSIEDVLSYSPNGVFFSNGPGDPATADPQVKLLREVLDRKIPFFGICLGNQLLGRALGYGTYKLPYGHRGVNQPVLDVESGKVEITAHNHGFAVDAPLNEISIAPHENGKYGRVTVSHIGLNDQVVEGLKCLDIPAFSVQYHPEAAAGPHDATYLFDRFVQLLDPQERDFFSQQVRKDA